MRTRYVIALLTPVGLLLAWLIVTGGLAAHLAEARPQIALRLNPHQPTALMGLAERALTQGAPAEAATYARRALKAAPLTASAYRVLGQTSDSQAHASKLFAVGWRLSRRDPTIAFSLYRQAMTEGRYAAALDFADALLRRSPRARSFVAQELVQAAADPDVTDLLVERLALRPTWRTAFLRELGRRPPSYEAATRLLQRLNRSAAPLKPNEAAALIAAMVAGGDYMQAYETWVSFLPPADRPAGPGVFDPSFRRPEGPTPFGWDVRLMAGSEARLDPQEGPGLRVYAGSFKGAIVARQLMAAPPGRYRLVSVGRLVEGPESLMEWRLACGDGRRVLARAPFTVDGGTERIGAEVVIPEACPAQWLVLRVLPGDQRARSAAVVDNVDLERMD